MILAVVMWPFAKVVAVLASYGLDGHEEGQDSSPSKAAGYANVVVSSHCQSHQGSLIVIVLHPKGVPREVRAWVLQRLSLVCERRPYSWENLENPPALHIGSD